ncbi:hypothetical protein HD554DRAFT_2077196 [Boletus coccyginus]|nr:hypothetical protein HD554DRAFT_2077196 [Boletus coccyginus]
MLKVSGIVRGGSSESQQTRASTRDRSAPICPCRSSHAPTDGSRLLDAPLLQQDQHPTRSFRSRSNLQVLPERVPSTVDFMISTNVPDDTANEQTWSTEEQMVGAATREEGRWTSEDGADWN